MSDEDSSENKDTDERRIIPRIPLLELFRQAWEELRQERNEDLTAQNVQIMTRDGKIKKLSCLEFWIHMFKEVEERKKLPDYLFSPIAEQKIWETFTVTLEDPTEDESAIFMRGRHYIPRPSNTYLQNLNLGYDQWYIVQDFPPKPKVIKILRRRPSSPSDNEDEILQHLIQAMDWACPTPSGSGECSSSTTIALPTTILEEEEEDEDRISSARSAARAILNVIQNSSQNTITEEKLNVTPNSFPDTRAILNVSPEPVEDEIGVAYDLLNDKTSVLHNNTSIVNDDTRKLNSSQEENINSIFSVESSQLQSAPLDQSQKTNQDWKHQGDHRQEYQQQFNQYGRGRRFRIQRTYRQPSSSHQRLPLTPAPAHLRLQSFNPRMPYPAHQALPHYDSAWNYSNSFAPYEVVPWNSNQLPFLPQTPVPQMYMQMPYVQFPAPHWIPSEVTQIPQVVYPSVMTPNPWIPQLDAMNVNTNIGQLLYYPAENYQVAHRPTYCPKLEAPQYFIPHPTVNNNMAHQSSIPNKNKDTGSYIVVRPEQFAAQQLEMNCKIIESQPTIQETSPDSEIPVRPVSPLPDKQSTQINVQLEENVQTQTTQPLKDSEIFKVPLPPKPRKSAVYYQSQNQQAGQKRRAAQSSNAIPQKDNKTVNSNEDKENKNPVDEREYLRTPSIFDILESRKKADPMEAEKAPSNYMEDVIQRKERRWKLMDKVPGSPRLNIVLDMIRKDNEMLEEEERLEREKEKSQTVTSYSTKDTQTKAKYDKSCQVKSDISQGAPIQIVDKEKQKRENEQTLKNLYNVQYFNAEDEPEPMDIEYVEPPVIYLPASEMNTFNQNEVLHFVNEQEDSTQCNTIPTPSCDENVQHTPASKNSETNDPTAAPIHAKDKIKVVIDDEEQNLLENLMTSTERFNPEIWVSDDVVLKLRDENIIKRKKPKPVPSQPTTTSSEVKPKEKQTVVNIQKIAKRPSPSPIRKQATNNDQPINKKKKKSVSEFGNEKNQLKQPVKICARDQATQTSDIQYEDNTNVAVETNDESCQTDLDIKPKILTYAAVLRKNKK